LPILFYKYSQYDGPHLLKILHKQESLPTLGLLSGYLPIYPVNFVVAGKLFLYSNSIPYYKHPSPVQKKPRTHHINLE